jgi:hypothetical protein
MESICDPCSEKNKMLVAEKYCSDCEEKLCMMRTKFLTPQMPFSAFCA